MLLCSGGAPVDQNRQQPRQQAGHNNGILAWHWSLLSPQYKKYLHPVFSALDFSYSQSAQLLLHPGRQGRHGLSLWKIYTFYILITAGTINGKTDWRSYRHFRSRNGVIFLNGNSWPPLKTFIICFRICTKSLEIWRKREFCPTSLK